MPMTRAEHLEWCRERALAELDDDPDGRGPARALSSMTSDLRKHPATAGDPGVRDDVLAAFEVAERGGMRAPAEVRSWIGSFR